MSPEAKRLLAQALAADTLGAGERERMLQGLTRKLARGEAALPEIDATPLVVPEASWLAKLLSSALGKLGLGALGALIVASGVLLLREAPPPAITARELPAPPAVAPRSTERRADTAPAPAPRLREALVIEAPAKAATTHRERKPRERHAASVPARAEPAPEPAPATHADAVTIAEEPAATEAERVLAPEPTPQPTPQPKPEPKPVSTLDDELVLLRRAYTELNAGRAQRAFDVLDAHAERYPHGELEEAREVARMLALCAMDREPAARVRAKHFLATHPDSPFAGRVRGICPPVKKRDTDPP